MKIIEQSREHDKVEIYRMTKDAGIKTMASIEDGTEISVESYLLYEDVDSSGVPQTILSIMDKRNNEVFACVSDTFKKSFFDICDIYTGDEDEVTSFTIRKISGKTKAGRDYINCTLVY